MGVGTDAQGADELGGVGAESQTGSSELQLPPPASSGRHLLHLGISLCLPLSPSLRVSRVPSASPASVSLRVSLPLPLVSPCFLSSLTLSRWRLSPVGAPAALVPSQPVSMRAPCRCQPARAVSVCLVPSGVPTLPTAPGRQEALNKYFLNE